MNYLLKHRADSAVAQIESARTPLEKYTARQEGLAVLADHERQISEDAALELFKAARPQSVHGVWEGSEVRDRPVFLIGPMGTRIVSPVVLPDGSKATPNPSYQIAVPMTMVPAMLARGFTRANSVTVKLDAASPNPANPSV